MRYQLNFIILFCCLIPALAYGECAAVAISGDHSSRFARRVLKEASLAGAKKYVQRAQEAADKAQEIAEECDYDEAAAAFLSVTRKAKAALEAEDLSSVKKYAREMIQVAEEGVQAAEQNR